MALVYDLVVIGGGTGGLGVALKAAKAGARVALVEKEGPAGLGALRGAVPSKGLVQAAKLVRLARSAGAFGVRTGAVEVDFPAVMERVRATMEELAREEMAEGPEALGIDVYRGAAEFEAYDTVRLSETQSVSGRRFVIATGSRPLAPDVPGLAGAGCLDVDGVWSLRSMPESLTVIGGDPVGTELAQCFARFGAKVTVLVGPAGLLPGEDEEAAERLAGALRDDGVAIRTNVELDKVETREGRKVVHFRDAATGAVDEAAGAEILVAAGRLARVEGLGLETVGVHASPEHGIEVDEHFQTHSARIYAVGDVLMRSWSAAAAEREAEAVFQSAVMGLRKRAGLDTVPRAVFTDPEYAAVGLTEARARAEAVEHRAYRAEFSSVARARIDGRAAGFAKVVVAPNGRILGATIFGDDAALIVQEFILAMENRVGLAEIGAAARVVPTLAEIVRRAAGPFLDARLEKRFVPSALRKLYGYHPRSAARDGSAAATATDASGHDASETHPATDGPGHGH